MIVKHVWSYVYVNFALYICRNIKYYYYYHYYYDLMGKYGSVGSLNCSKTENQSQQ